MEVQLSQIQVRNNTRFQIIPQSSTGTSFLDFGKPADSDIGGISYAHTSDTMSFRINTSNIADFNTSGLNVSGIVTATSFSGDGSNLTGVGGVAVQSAAPSSANVGDLWYDTDDGRMFVYYNDGNSAQWVDASPNGTPTDLVIEGDLTPATDNSSDLGASNKRWANVYSADLQLSNVGTGGNEVDRSEGSWTIQEGEEDLFLINRRNGKKYKFNLTEVS